MELYRVLVCVCGVFVGDTNVLFTDGMLACYKFDDWLSLQSFTIHNLSSTHYAGKSSFVWVKYFKTLV